MKTPVNSWATPYQTAKSAFDGGCHLAHESGGRPQKETGPIEDGDWSRANDVLHVYKYWEAPDESEDD